MFIIVGTIVGLLIWDSNRRKESTDIDDIYTQYETIWFTKGTSSTFVAPSSSAPSDPSNPSDPCA